MNKGRKKGQGAARATPWPHDGARSDGAGSPPRSLLLLRDVYAHEVHLAFEHIVEGVRHFASHQDFFLVVDLTENDSQGPRPEEILALHWEYTNMTAWERAYNLFAQVSKDRVPRETYVSVIQRDDQREPLSITDYSFPSVEVEGNRATVERVYSWSTSDEEGQEKRIQEIVLEDEGWRILMREEQYKFYLGE